MARELLNKAMESGTGSKTDTLSIQNIQYVCMWAYTYMHIDLHVHRHEHTLVCTPFTHIYIHMHTHILVVFNILNAKLL